MLVMGIHKIRDIQDRKRYRVLHRKIKSLHAKGDSRTPAETEEMNRLERERVGIARMFRRYQKKGRFIGLPFGGESQYKKGTEDRYRERQEKRKKEKQQKKGFEQRSI